jgi:hypothetical protein
MLATTVDLFERFRPAAAYTESDEISLVFAPADYYRTEEELQKAPSVLEYGYVHPDSVVCVFVWYQDVYARGCTYVCAY